MADDVVEFGARGITAPAFPRLPFPRLQGDIQTAVVNLVRRLAPDVPVPRQPYWARRIAEVIASQPSAMGHDMFLRQSIIRRGTATKEDVIEGLAAWVTVLFDLDNLQHDRHRALDVAGSLPGEALERLTQALAASRQGCILAVPHTGSIELFAARLKDQGFELGFVYTIGRNPTPTERWIYAGRSASGATPIAFGRRNTGAEIARILRNNGVVIMVVDVYPSDRYKGIGVEIHDASFNFPPGPARYAQSGTLVLPGYAARRDAAGFAMHIGAPLAYAEAGTVREAACGFTQKLAAEIGAFTAAQPEAYWLWHPIPNDPFHAIVQHHRQDLLTTQAPPDDEAVALAVEALSAVPAA